MCIDPDRKNKGENSNAWHHFVVPFVFTKKGFFIWNTSLQSSAIWATGGKTHRNKKLCSVCKINQKMFQHSCQGKKVHFSVLLGKLEPGIMHYLLTMSLLWLCFPDLFPKKLFDGLKCWLCQAFSDSSCACHCGRPPSPNCSRVDLYLNAIGYVWKWCEWRVKWQSALVRPLCSAAQLDSPQAASVPLLLLLPLLSSLHGCFAEVSRWERDLITRNRSYLLIC